MEGRGMSRGGAAAARRVLRDSTASEWGFSPDSIQARLLELGRQVPRRNWARVPRDGSRNLDHYLYGAPRQK